VDGQKLALVVALAVVLVVLVTSLGTLAYSALGEAVEQLHTFVNGNSTGGGTMPDAAAMVQTFSNKTGYVGGDTVFQPFLTLVAKISAALFLVGLTVATVAGLRLTIAGDQ